MHHDNVHALFQHLGTLSPSQGFWGTWGIYFREQSLKMRGTKAILWNSSLSRGTKRFISGVPAWERLNSASPVFKTKTIYKLIMPKYFTKPFCGGRLVSI